MKTLFAKALQRHGEVTRFAGMVAKLPVRKITLEYEWLLKDPANFARVYAFLGLTPPATTKKQTAAVKLHPTSVPWVDYLWRKDPATGRMACPWVEAKRGAS